MRRKILVALGGNAILTKNASAGAQKRALYQTAKYLVKFIEHGDQLILSHGNGPQVGNLLLQQEAGSTKNNPKMPLDTEVAMTQGSIGYWLQNALDCVLAEKKINKPVATVVTQVEVNPSDPAFKNPSKPIGPFMGEKEMETKKAQRPELSFIEDSGRGYRQVVASPKPIGIAEAKAISSLVSSGVVPIAVGGGGIPVVRKDQKLVGKPAVIDKDFASAELAELIGADALIILTDVKNIYLNFHQPSQKKLKDVSVAEMENYIKQNQFAKGSMLPKVQAALRFIKNTGHKAVITSLDNIADYLKNGSGTTIMVKKEVGPTLV